MLLAPLLCVGISGGLGSWCNRINDDHMPKTPPHSRGANTSALDPLVAQIRIAFNASSPADRVILAGRVLQTQILLPEATTAQEVADLTRAATTRGEADVNDD